MPLSAILFFVYVNIVNRSTITHQDEEYEGQA